MSLGFTLCPFRLSWRRWLTRGLFRLNWRRYVLGYSCRKEGTTCGVSVPSACASSQAKVLQVEKSDDTRGFLTLWLCEDQGLFAMAQNSPTIAHPNFSGDEKLLFLLRPQLRN